MPWIQTAGEPTGQEKRNPSESSDGLVFFFLIAVSGAGVLAMVATWLLVAHLPVPDDEAIDLGLLGFFFVLFATLPIAASMFLQGRNLLVAVMRSLGVFLLGLMTAVVVGSLPLLWRRLITDMPWVQDVPWFPLFLLWLVVPDFYLRRRRKLIENNRRPSRKMLIFRASVLALMSTPNFFSAASRFSDGRIWLGAVYLVVAILFGLLAFDVVVEIWRGRREKSSSSEVQI